ncbi:GtrA family protein [Herbaspirillum sp. ST 5-3]|uniref:GtrA family protein n=1 Tax=Oxalobacteraceae TaxID=75682 RepID=UPI0010A4BD5D|nr:GtrA family protein [Herbaspirillum sp. ST 5-3]
MGQFFRYIIVGVANSMVGYGVIFGCMYLLGLSPEASNVAGYAVGLVVSYVLNRTYTFNSKQSRRAEFMRFLVVFAIAYGLNFVALLILIHQLGLHEGASQIVAGVVYVLSAYAMNKYYVFKIPRMDRP